MKIKLVIIVVLLLTAATAWAEAPCTYLGHETLQGAVACAVVSRNNRRMDSHNNQILTNLATQPAIAPHPYPPTMPSFIPYMMMTGRGRYRGVHYMYPYSWYWTFPGY